MHVIDKSHHDMLKVEDNKIEVHNKKLCTAQGKLLKHQETVDKHKCNLAAIDTVSQPDRHSLLSDAITKASKTLEKSSASYQKMVLSGADLVNTGSGKVQLLNAIPLRPKEEHMFFSMVHLTMGGLQACCSIPGWSLIWSPQKLLKNGPTSIASTPHSRKLAKSPPVASWRPDTKTMVNNGIYCKETKLT